MTPLDKNVLLIRKQWHPLICENLLSGNGHILGHAYNIDFIIQNNKKRDKQLFRNVWDRKWGKQLIGSSGIF